MTNPEVQRSGPTESARLPGHGAGLLHGLCHGLPVHSTVAAAPCLLTNLLIELLEAAGWAKVINLSSLGHTWAKQGIQWEDIKWEQKFFDSWEV